MADLRRLTASQMHVISNKLQCEFPHWKYKLLSNYDPLRGHPWIIEMSCPGVRNTVSTMSVFDDGSIVYHGTLDFYAARTVTQHLKEMFEVCSDCDGSGTYKSVEPNGDYRTYACKHCKDGKRTWLPPK